MGCGRGWAVASAWVPAGPLIVPTQCKECSSPVLLLLPRVASSSSQDTEALCADRTGHLGNHKFLVPLLEKEMSQGSSWYCLPSRLPGGGGCWSSRAGRGHSPCCGRSGAGTAALKAAPQRPARAPGPQQGSCCRPDPLPSREKWEQENVPTFAPPQGPARVLALEGKPLSVHTEGGWPSSQRPQVHAARSKAEPDVEPGPAALAPGTQVMGSEHRVGGKYGASGTGPEFCTCRWSTRGPRGPRGSEVWVLWPRACAAGWPVRRPAVTCLPGTPGQAPSPPHVCFLSATWRGQDWAQGVAGGTPGENNHVCTHRALGIHRLRARRRRPHPVPLPRPPPPPAHWGLGPHIRASPRCADGHTSCWAPPAPSLLVQSQQSHLYAPPCGPTVTSPESHSTLAGGQGRPIGLDPGMGQWQVVMGPPTLEKKVTPAWCFLTLRVPCLDQTGVPPVTPGHPVPMAGRSRGPSNGKPPPDALPFHRRPGLRLGSFQNQSSPTLSYELWC